jgi:sugar phosphate isomerase/epimerase
MKVPLAGVLQLNMQVFLSTTFHGVSQTDLFEVLDIAAKVDVCGFELGSTHIYREDFLEKISTIKTSRFLTHNFFPPAPDPNLIINLASVDDDVRNASLECVSNCLQFASQIKAELYTVHPGFRSNALATGSGAGGNYDFNFSPDLAPHETCFENMLRSLEVLVKLANQLKIPLAIETEGSLTRPGFLLMEQYEEYDHLFKAFGDDIFLNCNLAHTRFAGMEHGYTLDEFITRYRHRFAAAELSHNNGHGDEHLPLIEGSYIFDYINKLPDIPLILEFRNSTIEEVIKSVNLLKEHSAKS